MDLGKQKSTISGDDINEYYIDNDADYERDMKEDEQGMRFDEFEEDEEEEIRTINDQNKHAFAETKQEKQGAHFLSL